jgi:hypothetical protein
LDILILSLGGLRPWQGRLTLGAQFEQAEQILVPLGFKRDPVAEFARQGVAETLAGLGFDPMALARWSSRQRTAM